MFPFSNAAARLLCIQCIDHVNPQVRDESARGLHPFELNLSGGLGPDPKSKWPKFDGKPFIYLKFSYSTIYSFFY